MQHSLFLKIVTYATSRFQRQAQPSTGSSGGERRKGPGERMGEGGMPFGLELIGIMQIENDKILIACIK